MYPVSETDEMNLLKKFIHAEASGGIVLMLSAALALIAVNNGGLEMYKSIMFHLLPLDFYIFDFHFYKALDFKLWVNDGLMAIFFFVIGLEIKKEFVLGELSSRDRAVLPVLAAVGGMIIPALVFVSVNMSSGAEQNLNGWAIPSATDIAFAIGIIAVVGSRVPVTLKVLLVAIAVIDDLGAIIIIAMFYTSSLSLGALAVGVAGLLVCWLMNRRGVMAKWPYLLIGIVIWLAVLKSGVHATLAGVFLALTIPLRVPESLKEKGVSSPADKLQHSFHPWVTFVVLPVFGFCNAGVSFEGMTFSSVTDPLTLGIILGLFFGKQIGILGTIWICYISGICPKPQNSNWIQIYGVAVLCGIGFTMSLFIGDLAFRADPILQEATAAPVRLGVLTGSMLSAILGYLVMRFAPQNSLSASKASS